MRPRLPAVSERELVRALAKVGYQRDHQTGGHLILRQTYPSHRRLTVPHHHEIARGTLRAIIREAGLTVDELLDSLG